jgi:exosortase A-associated hydrolase 1
MRRVLNFACEGATLWASLDEAPGSTGLLIVSGGNEIRIGAHRGMAMLAADVASAGHPVFRFDRRGIGDSEGENGGFENSAADMTAAVATFRLACPQLTRIVAFGNCDAASAIIIHGVAGIDAAIISNPWAIETQAGDAPPPAAIKAHYWQKLKDPKAVANLLTGAVDFKKLARGLLRVAGPMKSLPSPLSARLAVAMAHFPGPVRILLAKHDGTAATFLGEWKSADFAAARARSDITIKTIDSSSHSFSEAADKAVLREEILGMLTK